MISPKFTRLFLSAIAVGLTSCSTSKDLITCDDQTSLPIIKIAGEDFKKYWVSSRNKRRVHFDKKTEREIANGAIQGFVVAEHTINANGKISERKILWFYPDERVKEIYTKYAFDTSYRSVKCPAQPVRMVTTNYYTNSNRAKKQLEKIYNKFKNENAAGGSDASATRPF